MMMNQALKGQSPEAVEAAMQAHGHHDGNGEEPREPSPGWTEDGVRRLNEVEIRAEEKFDPSRARELAQHAAESRAARTSEAINAAFLERLGIKIGYGHPLSPKTFEHHFTWTPEAEARLENLPSYCRKLIRWRVEWTAAKKGLGPVITPEAMDVKFEMWDEVSQALQEKGPQMPWEPDAEKRLGNMPPFVKGQVMAAVEGNAQELGEERVTMKVMDLVIQKWIETGDFHEGRYGFRAWPARGGRPAPPLSRGEGRLRHHAQARRGRGDGLDGPERLGEDDPAPYAGHRRDAYGRPGPLGRQHESARPIGAAAAGCDARPASALRQDDRLPKRLVLRSPVRAVRPARPRPARGAVSLVRPVGCTRAARRRVLAGDEAKAQPPRGPGPSTL